MFFSMSFKGYLNSLQKFNGLLIIQVAFYPNLSLLLRIEAQLIF